MPQEPEAGNPEGILACSEDVKRESPGPRRAANTFDKLRVAVALGLGSVPVGAYEDGEVARTLSLPRELRPLYIVTVGQPR